MIRFKEKEQPRGILSVVKSWYYRGYKIDYMSKALDILSKKIEEISTVTEDNYFDEIINAGISHDVRGNITETYYIPYVIVKRNYYVDKFPSKYDRIKLKNNHTLD